MGKIELAKMCNTCLSILALNMALAGTVQASSSSSPLTQGKDLNTIRVQPNTIPNTTCPIGENTQDQIDLAYEAHRDNNYDETLEALDQAWVCAKLGKGLNPDQIDDYRIAFSAADSEDPNNWPPFPFAVTQTPVANNGNSSNSDQVLPAIVGALGGVLESAIQNSDNQNPGNQPAQPASQAPPSVASSTANDQSQQASSILAQWGLQQVPCDSPGLVFISGLSNDVVCINPTHEIPAGEYRYNAQTHQLIDVSSAPGVSTSD